MGDTTEEKKTEPVKQPAPVVSTTSSTPTAPQTDTSGGSGTLGLGSGDSKTDAELGKTEKDPEAEARDKAQKDLEAFKKAPHAKKDHEPSTGRGVFDVQYTPGSSELLITLRVDLEAVDGDTERWGGPSFWDRLFGSAKKEENEWFEKYQALMAARWSGQYGMSCTKKYWEELKANTKVSIVRDKTNPHFKLKVTKMAAGDYYGDSSVAPPGGQNLTARAPGDTKTMPNGGAGTTKLGSTDLTPKSGHREQATRETDVDRVRALNPGQVKFGTDSADVIADVAKLTDMGKALSMIRVPPLTINLTGRSSTSGADAHNLDLSRRRAEAVKNLLTSQGQFVHTVNVVAKGEEGAGPEADWQRVDIEIPYVDNSFVNAYDIAGHETGHMLGLGDEYPGAGVAAQYQLTEEAFGKTLADTFLKREGSSSSIMSSGLDVRPYHYVTFWEALGEVTKPELLRTDWSIGM